MWLWLCVAVFCHLKWESFGYLLSQCADVIQLSFLAERKCHMAIFGAMRKCDSAFVEEYECYLAIFCRNVHMKFGYLLWPSADVIRLSLVAMCRWYLAIFCHKVRVSFSYLLSQCADVILLSFVAQWLRCFRLNSPRSRLRLAPMRFHLSRFSIFSCFCFTSYFAFDFSLLFTFYNSISGWVVLTSFLVEDTQLYKRLCPSVG